LDSHNIYSTLKNTFNFSKIIIPLNPRASKNTIPTSSPNVVISEDGVPICKKLINLLNLKANVRVKIVLSVLNGLALCLLTKMANVFALALSLVLPLNLAAIVYTYPDDFRSSPGINRNSQEFFDLYNKRVAC